MPTNQLNERVGTIALETAAVEEADAALVAAAKSGRNQAFEILVGRYQARILSVVLRFTGNREDAEDIAQQSFQKAFVHLQQFEGISSFSTWLTRIAMNEALMWLRGNTRHARCQSRSQARRTRRCSRWIFSTQPQVLRMAA